MTRPPIVAALAFVRPFGLCLALSLFILSALLISTRRAPAPAPFAALSFASATDGFVIQRLNVSSGESVLLTRASLTMGANRALIWEAPFEWILFEEDLQGQPPTYHRVAVSGGPRQDIPEAAFRAAEARLNTRTTIPVTASPRIARTLPPFVRQFADAATREAIANATEWSAITSPDGRYAAFICLADWHGVCTYDYEAREDRLVATLPGTINGLRWSPDGRFISAMLVDADLPQRLAIVDAQARAFTVLPELQGFAVIHDWSPNSDWLLVAVDFTEVYRVRPDGDDQQRVYQAANTVPRAITDVDWSPPLDLPFAGEVLMIIAAGVFVVGGVGMARL